MELTERIAAMMEQLPTGVDAALIQSDIDRRYFTGMASTAGTLLCFRDEAYLIIDFRYIEKAKSTVQHCKVIRQQDIYPQLERLLKEHGARRVAIEAMTMTLHQYAELKRHLEGVVEFDKSDALSRAIRACRMVKSAEEIAKIRRAQEIAEIAYQDILGFIRPGVSEREIMLRLNQTMLHHGSEGESFPTIALTGAATSMPHGVPSAERLVQKGDFVLMDYGATWEGYHSDMTRTVCVGQPSDKQRKVYETVLAAQCQALDTAKAGITGKSLDKAAREVIEAAGFGEYFGHALGHGVGLEIHEYPNASPGAKTVFQPGNVVTIEPGIYLPGEFGVRIEDFVVIGDDGCENLTHAPKELCILD